MEYVVCSQLLKYSCVDLTKFEAIIFYKYLIVPRIIISIIGRVFFANITAPTC